LAVYTPVDRATLAAFLAAYELGEVRSFEGIRQGVENTNYRLETTSGRYILTIYEKRVDPADLPFFLGLLDHLAARGVRCPLPVHGRDGAALRELAGKPAAIVTFLDGSETATITAAHTESLGRALAGLHEAGEGFALHRCNALSLAGWHELARRCRDRADQVEPGLARLIADELAWLEARWPSGLPQGVIHADLFPDNVFFEGTTVTGLIDFYFACDDLLAYDLAICVNAWAFDAADRLEPGLARALVRGYLARRRLSPAEIAAFPMLCRGAALRFLLTRLYDWLNRVDGALVRPKDPLEYARKLRHHQTLGDPEAYGLG
jgi:homoserine kinase type II